MKHVYLHGKRIELAALGAIGQGGEAEVFDLGGGRALKVFKRPDHPDYQGLPHEQAAAEARIAIHQRKLRALPAGLPPRVVVPGALATDRTGAHVVGYEMRLVRPAEPLCRYADAAFRHAGVPSSGVVELFRELSRTLSLLHRAGVVVGDLNDLNILVQAMQGHFIDADSFQFGGFPCTVFSERFVDPLLCDPAAPVPVLSRPYTESSDWYAFAALLMQSLLSVGPWGGVYRPSSPASQLPHRARPLQRITVFHARVVYPKPATPYRVLPDGLLHHFHGVFERDLRRPFPEELFDELVFSRCEHCRVEHTRLSCPSCAPLAQAPVRETVRVRREVSCERRFVTEGDGVILHAAANGAGGLSWVYHQSGAYRREDGSLLFSGELEPRLRFRIQGDATWAGLDGEMVRLHRGSPAERLAVDSDGSGPAFDTHGASRSWAAGGRLFRQRGEPDSPWAAAETVGEVLSGQTRLWMGPTFGLALARAGGLSLLFLFDNDRCGLREAARPPPLRGTLVDGSCTLDEERAWLFLALHSAGRTRHLCLVYSRRGALEAVAEAEAGDGSWLGTLAGKCAVGGVLLALTDAGCVRVEVTAPTATKTRDFPDTEPFVDAASQLCAGRDGLWVISRREVSLLKMR